ncbi:hypothetical protein HQ35_05930 [Porphyromonas cangingivalis]|uniref:HD-CE domain-containing protein n=1 Tax=Porphyromonas cangingivalis TaxID=36874 RepID=A0A0A2EMZ8_PORCN|nr:ATP-binding protein [Porphyromonas cangingivalis]KGN80231.1 hypothetical protein HQ35_05930 [Porphyromonas cangingivalis]
MSSLIDSILGEKAQTDQLSQEFLPFVRFLKKQSESHLKRVIKTLPEFDLHDQSHSEKVEENMSLLIGESLLRKLSSVDLFLLSASAHLHDCGMAPADWELNALDVVAKATDRRFDVLKNNINYIKDNKVQIFGRQGFEASSWLFSPSDEKELFKQLANEMKAYQEYLDGYSISETNDKDDKDAEQILKDRRVDYIRRTHHERSERYIKNMEKEFCGKLESAPGKQLADILAGICRAHGEDLSYTSSELKSSITISAKYKVNPQFVAMMLRLGDIIHFSKDRAPFVLRNATQFKSDYSHYQWELKEGGVNYQIVDGKVIYTAYCEEPKLYYGLLEYTDWIKREIANFNELKRNWSKEYKDVCVDEVNTSDITYDSNKFIPAPGKKFTLSQDKIIKLLMGVQLYKEPYACIRELYQNALDAVRCNIDKNKSLSKDIKGFIEFGLETDERGKFLYCLDNGVGMSQFIIENYLLNIGSSYYKSQDFFRLQHKWNSSFTPTSQFGIGILSCFMIGDAMEIITKTDNDKEPRIICIDGPLELVYYKPVSPEDAELIHSSGTMVKIYLQEPFQILHERKGYGKNADLFYDTINNYITIAPKNINVRIKTKSRSLYFLSEFPHCLSLDRVAHSKTIEFREFDKKSILSFENEANIIHIKNYPYSCKENRISLSYHYVTVGHNGIEFHTVLLLPLQKISLSKSAMDEILLTYFKMPRLRDRVCIDGIFTRIDKEIFIKNDIIKGLSLIGTLNFIGKDHPNLSIDRSLILSVPEVLNTNIKLVLYKFFEYLAMNILSPIQMALNDYDRASIDLILEYAFQNEDIVYNKFFHWILSGQSKKFVWQPLCKVIGNNLSVSDFFNMQSVQIPNYNFLKMDRLTQDLIMAKIISSEDIHIDNDKTLGCKFSSSSTKNKQRSVFNKSYSILRGQYTFFKINSNLFSEYDFIPKLYPFVSCSFFHSLESSWEFIHISPLSKKTMLQGILAHNSPLKTLIQQDPSSIHPRLGLHNATKNKQIYEFSEKVPPLKIFKPIQKKQNVVMVYIASRVLSEKEKKKLECLKEKEPDYYKGVQEGWSLLLTGMDEENIKILPGLRSRKELVETISDYFWEIYSEYTFEFTDGKNLKDYKI